MKRLGFFLCASFLPFMLNAQLVNTQFGPIQGSNNGAIKQFLGIPFAKPPIADLRWKAPQNPDTWTSTLITTEFSPVCPQKNFDQGGINDTVIGNEDCLYLNVWTPQLGESDLPVLVFIHGGGNQQGSASEENGGAIMFFGKNIAERGNAVVVTIQYRLGPLGFLVHPGLEAENTNSVSGNYAVMDQLLALNWVKNNIAAFGGNPNKVMVFGESAGGVNVGNLLTTSHANGLFQRAAIQSAGPVIGTYQSGLDRGISYVDSFITTGSDAEKISYMRSLPADSLVKDENPPLSGGAVGMNWQAVIDQDIFTDFPLQKIQSGNFNQVPLIIGSNSEEMSLSAPATVFPFMVTALINSYIPAPFQAQATTLYPPGNNTTEARASYVNFFSDAQFTVMARRTAQCVSSNQDAPVYRYYFSHKHSIPALANLGSYHGMELFYVFNTWEDATLGSGPLFSEQDDSVQIAMLQYWVNFANTGNPNGTNLVNWPEYDTSSDCYLEIKASPNGTQCGLRTEKCDFWDAVSGFIPCEDPLEIQTPSNIEQLLIYPNPTNGIVHLFIPKTAVQIHVTVYSLIGQQVYSANNLDSIDLTSYTDGVYWLEVKTENQVFQSKLIKTKF